MVANPVIARFRYDGTENMDAQEVGDALSISSCLFI
jgi:hypothetical protein